MHRGSNMTIHGAEDGLMAYSSFSDELLSSYKIT